MGFIYLSFSFLPFECHYSGNKAEQKSGAPTFMMTNESTNLCWSILPLNW